MIFPLFGQTHRLPTGITVVDACCDLVAAGQTIQHSGSSIVFLEENISGDLTGEGKVDFADLAVLAEQWLSPPGNPSADIAPQPDSDNIVNFLDFAELVENWQGQ